MKKLLFVINNMEIGGTRTSLLSLLSALSKRDDIVVDLYILGHYGILYDRIPKQVNVLPMDFIVANTLPKKKNKTVIGEIYHILFHIAKRIIGYEKIFSFVFSKVARKVEKNRGTYDAVIGYQEGISNYFSSFISARKHLVWIHNDIEHWYDDETFTILPYQNADKICFVAEAAKEKFTDRFEQLLNRCVVIKNTINIDQILSKAAEEVEVYKNEGKYLLVSVGRITEQKAFHRSGRVYDLNPPDDR